MKNIRKKKRIKLLVVLSVDSDHSEINLNKRDMNIFWNNTKQVVKHSAMQK